MTTINAFDRPPGSTKETPPEETGQRREPGANAPRDTTQRPLSIADSYSDLLEPLTGRRRNGIIAMLSVGYLEGWHPTRYEVAKMVAQQLPREPPRR
jgi:hypothetical protein